MVEFQDSLGNEYLWRVDRIAGLQALTNGITKVVDILGTAIEIEPSFIQNIEDALNKKYGS